MRRKADSACDTPVWVQPVVKIFIAKDKLSLHEKLVSYIVADLVCGIEGRRPTRIFFQLAASHHK